MAERHKYDIAQRVFLIMNYYRLHVDYQTLFEMFARQYLNAVVPSHVYVHQLHKKFQQLGTVADVPWSGRPHTPCTEENKILMAQANIKDPRSSQRHMVQQFEFSRWSLMCIMHELNLRVYQPHLLQQL